MIKADPVLSKRRSACDRCHSHKLRCSKATGTGSCERCLKLRAQCIFSPTMRGLVRPGPNQTRGRRPFNEMNHEGRASLTTDGLKQMQDGLFDPMLLDWISMPAQSGQEMQGFDPGELSYGGIDLGLDGQMLQPTAARSLDAQGKATDSQPSSLGHNQTEAFGVETDVHPQHDKQGAFTSARSSTVSIIQELAELSAGLAEHAATVPPHSIYDSPHICPFDSEPEATTSELSLNQTAWNGRSSLCPKCFGKGHVFSIDQTFRHTEKLLELYSRLINSIVIADAHLDSLLTTAGSSNTSRRISSTTLNPVILDDSHTPANGEDQLNHTE